MAEYAEIALVGPLARAFALEAPGATLRLLPATGRGIAEQLERGAIDVAVAFVGNLPPHIEATILLRDPFVVVARQDHPVAARPMSLEAYAAQNHVLVSPRGTTTGALDRILVDFGLKRYGKPAFRSPSRMCCVGRTPGEAYSVVRHILGATKSELELIGPPGLFGLVRRDDLGA